MALAAFLVFGGYTRDAGSLEDQFTCVHHGMCGLSEVGTGLDAMPVDMPWRLHEDYEVVVLFSGKAGSDCLVKCEESERCSGYSVRYRSMQTYCVHWFKGLCNVSEDNMEKNAYWDSCRSSNCSTCTKNAIPDTVIQ